MMMMMMMIKEKFEIKWLLKISAHLSFVDALRCEKQLACPAWSIG